MNKLGIFMNFWEKGWAADHKKYIRKAAENSGTNKRVERLSFFRSSKQVY